MKKSTFTRKTKPTNESQIKPSIQSVNAGGIKPSIYTSQLVVSSGLDELDEIFQGGIAVGSVVMIEEDNHTRHFKSLINYFISEAIYSEQGVFLCSSSFNPAQSLITQIPSQQAEEIDLQKQQLEQKAIDEMKIAWRYKEQFKSNEIQSKYSPFFSLSQIGLYQNGQKNNQWLILMIWHNL